MASKRFTDVNLAEYKQCRVTSYTGGATWLKTPWGVFFVIPGAPVQIRKELESGKEVRAEIV